MQVMKWSVIALAVAAGTSQLAFASAQSESNGFVEDSSLNVLTRSLYFNRDWRNGNPRAADGKDGKAEEWGLGFIGTYESGFTQGTVGFGVDAIGLLGVKVDSGRGRSGTGLFPEDSDGRSQDDYSEAGGAVKLRVSNTVLKYGDQFTALPVFNTDDSRLLPQSTTGFLLTSNEIAGLELNAGHFTAMNAQNQTGRDSYGIAKSVDLIGGTYSFTDNLSASLYYADNDDVAKKFYGNLNYNFDVAEGQNLGFDFNIYRTKYDNNTVATDGFFGNGVEGDRNTIWSLSSTYGIGAHAFTVAYQKSSGDVGYAYDIGDGGGTVWLANSVQRSDFNSKDEKSAQLRYDLDFADYGVPGLKFMARYVKGWGMDNGANTEQEKEWERNLQVSYTLQDGPAKDLNMRVRQATYRADDGYQGGKIDEVRVILEYPLSIL
ncbi:OprD family porin [Ectopseudomonas oleovorans]|uniref:Porin D n=1 Tax=Ectopseudomonas oleovorans (strain CECT 5344) TaxID=1182590 RepID=W6QYV0_ECTO5|nr:OprD family porin [Pseudomonas oleovorans]CDM41652.1 Porin D [Pseudomonas oleovorans CECT 5344]CDR92280.1 Porin D [Pseudomonas oleovorans]